MSVVRPRTVNAQGLFDVVELTLQKLGISSIDSNSCTKLVGVGTDGASANIAAAGLKGLFEDEIDWIFWMWCLAHRLELAVKDALKDSSFALIDELLLRLYYIYQNSPKKCRELADIIDDLKEFFDFDGGGIRPIRACGSRWLSHKLNAMKRVLSKYGAYTQHLAALSEDSSIKSTDRAKLQGYYKKWTQGQYVVGCAVFVDLLTPCAIFSKVMQVDEIDILGALTSLMKTIKETDKLKSRPLEEWPTYALSFMGS